MVKTPEEYFEDHLFDVVHAESSNSFTAAEASFMSKYLGVNESEALERLGLLNAVEPECVLAPMDLKSDGGAQDTAALSAAVAGVETLVQPASQPQEQPEPPVGSQPSMAAEDSMPALEDIQVVERSEEVIEPVAQTKSDAVQDDFTNITASDDWVDPQFQREPDLLDQLRHESELQMVSFFLGKQEFTVPISTVQEVIRFIPPTKLPVAPPFVTGVINLRGSVTPIIQLRELLGISCTEEAEKTNKFIVVCKRHGLQFGLVIDTVHTMYRVPQESIDWAVESHLGVAVQYIFGLMKSDDMLIGIISVDNIVEAILEG